MPQPHIEVARDIVRAAFRSCSELQALLGTLKSRCSPDEYKAYAQDIAAAMDAIGVNLINKAIAQYPELGAEIDQQINKHGQYS